MNGTVAVVATVVSGILYSRAFPTTAIRPLAFVALVPLLLALRTGTRRRAIVLAALWGVVAAYGLNDWFPRAVATYYLQSWAVGAALFLAVAGLTASPFFVVFALVYRRLARRPTALLPLLAAAAWTGAELARTEIGGDPWGLLGYSQVGVLPLMQAADVGGVYAIGFVVAAVNLALTELALAVRARGAARRPGLAGAGLVATVCAAGVLYGEARLRAFEPDAASGGHRVAVVQGNLDLGSQWNETLYGENLAAYLARTWTAIHDAPPTLVVWPESALTFFLDEEPAYRAAIAHVLAPVGAELLTGGPRRESEWPPVFFNAAFVIDAAGTVTASYDKERLLPFAEYFPVPALDFMRRRFARVREFTSGTRTAPLPTIAGPAGILICNEGLFGAPAAHRAAAGAAFLVNLANDSWVGDPQYSAQAFDMVVLRAVEQRRFLVRASTSGPSAIVDPAGRVVTRTQPFTATTVDGRVVGHTDATLYARAGDAFAAACVVAALGGALAAGRA